MVFFEKMIDSVFRLKSLVFSPYLPMVSLDKFIGILLKVKKRKLCRSW